MGTEKNDASVAPIPAPPVTPAVPGPPMPAGAGVAFTPVSAQGKKRMKLIGILVGVLVVLVIAGVVAIKVVNSSRTPEAEVRKYLDLLAAGKASAATAMVDPGVPNNQRTFLTDDAMASATSLLVVEDVGEALAVHLQGSGHRARVRGILLVSTHVFDDQQRGRPGHGLVCAPHRRGHARALPGIRALC